MMVLVEPDWLMEVGEPAPVAFQVNDWVHCQDDADLASDPVYDWAEAQVPVLGSDWLSEGVGFDWLLFWVADWLAVVPGCALCW